MVRSTGQKRVKLDKSQKKGKKLRHLAIAPNEVLKKPGRKLDVSDVNDELLIRDLRREMSKILRQVKGLGITAHQVGEPVNFFIVDGNKLPGTKKFNYFINAEVEYIGKPELKREACLSLPGKVFAVERYPRISVKAQLMNGKWRERKFSGLTAQCIQQEYDHTRGILLEDVGTLIEG